MEAIQPTSHCRQQELLLECERRLSNSCLLSKCCCVCDCLHSARDIETKHINRCKVLLQTMRRRLKPPPSLCNELIMHYDASASSPVLAGMLLSKNGILSTDPSDVILQICKPCHDSLSRKKLTNAPKFAIANGLFIGELDPGFDDSSVTEHAMVNLAQPTRFMAVVQGGKHTSIRSHAYYFRSEPSPPAAMLPTEVVSKGTIGVTMVGCMTPIQKAKTMKRYQVRVSRLFDQLLWYRTHNRLYKDVTVANRSNLESFTSQTSVVLDCAQSSDSAEDENEEKENGSTHGGDKDSTYLGMAQQLDESHLRHNEPRPAHLNVRTGDEEVMQQVNAALVTNFGMEDDIQLTRRILEKHDVVVRRSSAILSDFDNEFWVYSFCELFPFGRGGLDEERRVSIGLEEFVRYCLRLSSRRFARHPSFALVAFDIIAKHRAFQAVYLCSKISPQTMSSAASVNREQLLDHVKHLQDRRNAIASNTHVPDPPLAPPPVRDLFSAIGTGLRSFYGSNHERAQARAKVMSMQLAYGQPAIFFTITPDRSGTYRVANLAGEMSDNLLDSSRSSLHDCLEYTKTKLGQIATSNPVACAKYFHHVMNIIVEVVLNWDTGTHCSKRGSGLFGVTRAYFSSTESQGSTGNLHAHMLIWVDGMPKTVDDYYTACQSDTVRRRLMAYVESIASASFPIDTAQCPRCNDNMLSAEPFAASAFQKPARGSTRPVTATCSNCLSSYGADEVVRCRLEKYAALNEIEPVSWSGPATHHARASPACLPLYGGGAPQQSLIVCQSLLEYQVHHWHHCRSCFKSSKRTPTGTVCRMFFPKEPVVETKWAADDKVSIRRQIGCEYLNAYIPLINSAFKSNHDVKFLTAAEGPEKAYYMLKYATKDQNAVENLLAIHLHAYDKAQQRLAQCDTAISTGRRCVQSMCCALTNPQEVSAPLAALYLERESPFYYSVEFQNLHIWSCVSTVFKNSAVSVLLARGESNSVFRPTSPYFDYIYRPESLENTNMMTFYQLWEKKKNKQGLKFQAPHTQTAYHTLHRRDVPAICCMLGRRLPDMRNIDVVHQEREDYQRAMLVLFHPFRNAEDFNIPRDSSVNVRFEEWWRDSAPDEARTFASHSNDYYASRELARQRIDEDKERYLACLSGSSQIIDSDSETDSIFDPDEPNDDFTAGDDTAVLSASCVHTNMIPKANDAATLSAESQRQSTADSLSYNNVGVDELYRCIANAEQALLQQEQAQATQLRLREQSVDGFPTQVSMLTQALAESSFWPGGTTHTISHHPENISLNAPLKEVSLSYRLNKKQHKVFVRVAKPFLESLLSNDSVPQVIAFLGGPPGSGKSQVIRAFQSLASSWGSDDAIRTVAYQGVAAEAANGQTIHKLFQWGIRKGAHTKRYTISDKEKFAGLKLLIMDEVSTTDAKFIGMIDIALRQLKSQPDKRFGGVHILFAGDWLQQLPVAGHPAFLSQPPLPNSRQHSSSSCGVGDEAADYFLRQRGIDSYREINEVVMLEENMRHRDDPVWRDILSRWRFGDYRQDDVDLVNLHCSDKNWSSLGSTQLKYFCPIIVTSNALRVEFNELAARSYCKCTGEPLHYFPASVSHSRFKLTHGQIRSLKSIRSDKTGGLPMLLPLAIGLPLQCTKNISRALHLANGTIGTAVHFQLSDDDSETVFQDGGVNVHLHTQPVAVVVLKLHERTLQRKSIVSCFPDGMTPVRRSKHAGVKICIRDRSFSLTVDQAPSYPHLR